MKTTPLYIIIFALFLFASCKTAKLKGPERYIVFGHGGGFVGKEHTYKLSSYGKLTVANTEDSVRELKIKVSQKNLKKIFALADSVQKTAVLFVHPGNVYYFISLKNNTRIPDYTWGETNYTAPEPLMRLYEMLNQVKSTAKVLKSQITL